MSTMRKRNFTQFLILLIAVVSVVAGSIGFQKWWNDRPGPDPHDVTITVKSDSDELTITPYTVCEPGVECPEGEVPEISAGNGTLKVSVPESVFDHDWSLLQIYDDPAANDQRFFKGHESKEAEIPVQSESGSRLVVTEVSTVMIGHDDSGAETPYTVVWSVKTK